MSTRCNVVIKDSDSELIFYRHSDGYPECMTPFLNHFVGWLKNGLIRNNVGQAAGWIILLGAMEYKSVDPRAFESYLNEGNEERESSGFPDYELNEYAKPLTGIKGRYGMEWKVGSIEPTTGMHGDIDYLYVVDLETKTVHIDGVAGYKYEGVFYEPSED